MKLSELLEICEFTEFPFDIKPTKAPQVWIGRKEVLSELIHLRDNVLVNGLSEFGIITGDHGSGKSQALLHLRFLADSMRTSIDVPRFTVYIDNPIGLGPRQSFVENYNYVVGNGFGFDAVKRIFATANEVVGTIYADRVEDLKPEERKRYLKDEKAKEELSERIYFELAGNTPIPYRVFLKIAEGDRKAWDWLSGADTKNSEIGGENVQKMTNIICAKSLATIIKLGTLRNPKGEPYLLPGVFILVDQAEDLPVGKSFNEQIVGWRTLIDEVDKGFGLLWAMDGGAEDIYANFTDAIHRRQTVATEKLRLEPLEGPDAISFLSDVMQSFRRKGAKVPSAIYPFKKDGLEEVLTHATSLLPGNLLNICRQVVTKVAEDDVIESKDDTIDAETVRRYA